MLDPQIVERVLCTALARGGEYADVFCERKSVTSFRLQSGLIHESALTKTQGAGIRVIAGESAGYAYSDDLSLEALERAARVASLIARSHSAGARSVRLESSAVQPFYDDARSQHEPAETYVALLERADVAARAQSPLVAAVNAHVADELQEVWIGTSDGRWLHDRRPLVSLGVQVVTSHEKQRAYGFVGDGGRTSGAYYQTRTPESIAIEAARIAVTNLDAVPAPAGEMEMIVGSGGGGVLLHEAVGHGLEGDFNREQTSLYSGRIGERVASELVTIFDDGNIDGERGSISIDDEGTPGQHKVLVDRGVLQSYMLDRLNGRLMGGSSTGSGRRQNFRFLPQPRMCNTYMPAGGTTFDEIIRSVDRGVYAKSFAGGQVDISRGDFVFMIAEGYLIEGGKISAPIRGATLIGNGPAIMERVVAVGNDARLANGQYTCGKNGQMVPVGVGLPTVKISSLTVGGSAVG